MLLLVKTCREAAVGVLLTWSKLSIQKSKNRHSDNSGPAPLRETRQICNIKTLTNYEKALPKVYIWRKKRYASSGTYAKENLRTYVLRDCLNNRHCTHVWPKRKFLNKLKFSLTATN